jgi:hypothetical protein
MQSEISPIGGPVLLIFRIGRGVWFDGFFGSLTGIAGAILVSVFVARRQTSDLRQKVELDVYWNTRERYEQSLAEMLRQVQAIADRARRYALVQSERGDAIERERYSDLEGDAKRELTRLRFGLGQHPILESFLRVPNIFRSYATLYRASLSQARPRDAMEGPVKRLLQWVGDFEKYVILHATFPAVNEEHPSRIVFPTFDEMPLPQLGPLDD